eukprot:2513940-Prymnesium_polylepis.1
MTRLASAWPPVPSSALSVSPPATACAGCVCLWCVRGARPRTCLVWQRVRAPVARFALAFRSARSLLVPAHIGS